MLVRVRTRVCARECARECALCSGFVRKCVLCTIACSSCALRLARRCCEGLLIDPQCPTVPLFRQDLFNFFSTFGSLDNSILTVQVFALLLATLLMVMVVVQARVRPLILYHGHHSSTVFTLTFLMSNVAKIVTRLLFLPMFQVCTVFSGAGSFFVCK